MGCIDWRRTTGLVASIIATWTIALSLAGAAPMSADTRVSRFEQDRFAIGFWVDPPVDEQAEARYADIAEADFNLVLALFGPASAADQERVLELSQRHGPKAIVAQRDTPPEELVDGPACWGYALRDEPSVPDFGALRARVDALRAGRPGRLAYVNLYPGYATPEQMGADTYAEYVERFVNEVDVDVLSMDHYPRFHPDGDGRDGYCADLAVMRAQSLAAGIPFWNFFNTMPYGAQTDPTEDQLRWQIFASLTYGARGILYFCYFTPPGSEFPKGGAILHRDFDVPAERVVEVSQATGTEAPVVDDSPAMEGLQVSLDAGEGRLFLLPAP